MSNGNKDSLYKKMIMKQLYFYNTRSCAELSAGINKSIPLTNKMVEELVADGYVTETGLAPSSGGRRPLMYAAKPGMLYAVSVAMDQFVTRIVIVDMQNQYATTVEKFELPLSNNPGVLQLLTEKIRQVIGHSGIDRSRIIGIGIGMPGFVNAKEGMNYTFLATDKKETTASHISRNLDLPVYIDNDSSLIALAELRFGSALHKKNVLVVNIGWGVGLGMLLNGELFRGHNGFAGEFSHIPLFSNGKLCSCGKSGCLETETSLSVIIQKAIEGLKSGRVSILTREALTGGHPEENFRAIITAAVNGDRFAIELFSEAGYNIGRGVATLIHILNPELVILSGRGSLAGKILEAPIWQAMHEYCIPRLMAATKVEVSSLGYEAEIIGAAALAVEHFEKNIQDNFFKNRLKPA